jgi:hypothetical protein
MIELVPASPIHVGPIATRMREIDRIECQAMGKSPKQALRAGLYTSDDCVTAMVDGVPEAMFGLVIESALSGRGTPWFLGTDEVYRNPRAMLAVGPQIIAGWRDSTPSLHNLVARENVRAIRMLRAWGFAVWEEVILTAGVEFVRFSMGES